MKKFIHYAEAEGRLPFALRKKKQKTANELMERRNCEQTSEQQYIFLKQYAFLVTNL